MNILQKHHKVQTPKQNTYNTKHPIKREFIELPVQAVSLPDEEPADEFQSESSEENVRSSMLVKESSPFGI